MCSRVELPWLCFHVHNGEQLLIIQQLQEQPGRSYRRNVLFNYVSSISSAANG